MCNKCNCKDISFTCKTIVVVVFFFQEAVTVFLHWQHKLSTLYESSSKVLPIHLRTSPVDHYRPVTSLCHYKTDEVCRVSMQRYGIAILIRNKYYTYLGRSMFPR